MTDKFLVIGGGIVGISTALHLQRRGQSVVLADANKPGEPGQASFGNAGILAREGIMPNASPATLLQFPKLFSGHGPFYVDWQSLPFDLRWIWDFVMSGRKSQRENFAAAMNALLYDTLDQHLNLAKGTAAEKLIKLGDFTLLYPNRAMRRGDMDDHALRSEFGIEFTFREPDILHTRDPHLGPAYPFAVDFHDHGWLLSPSAYLKALFDDFRRRGGGFLNQNVVQINGTEVMFEDGNIGDYAQIVLAAGVGARFLAIASGHKIPMRSERGYHLSLYEPNIAPPNPYLIMDNKFGFTPMDGFIRAAGQSDLSPADAAPKPKAFDNLKRAVNRVYPNLRPKRIETWMGARPTLKDQLPMVGRSKHNPKLVFAFGSQHLGLTMGPKLGQIAADILMDQKMNFDLSPYSPHRFE